MSERDYGDLVGSILSDRQGNGYRLESAARLAHAFTYSEAAKACADTAVRGFPLSLVAQDETFFLSLTGLSGGPCYGFERKREALSVMAVNVPSAALGDRPPRHEWTPGDLTPDKVKEEVQRIVEWCVTVLASCARLARTS